MTKSKTETFEEGDLVAVFGGQIGKDAHKADTITITKVAAVGQEDLVVEAEEFYTLKRYIVPKTVCKKLKLDPDTVTSSQTLRPSIGDLVLSFSSSAIADKDERMSGILYKITYRLGKPDKCEILCGTEMVAVPWHSLVVIRQNSD